MRLKFFFQVLIRCFVFQKRLVCLGERYYLRILMDTIIVLFKFISKPTPQFIVFSEYIIDSISLALSDSRIISSANYILDS